eukprot:m.188870 g.188870  ORF g.188870 m.188870 type:complete len:175 (-) comp32360_c0_seq4:186-710(-)
MGTAISIMDMSSRPLALVESDHEDHGYENTKPLKDIPDPHEKHSVVSGQRELFPITETCCESDCEQPIDVDDNTKQNNTNRHNERYARCSGGGGGDNDCVRDRTDTNSRGDVANTNKFGDTDAPTKTNSKQETQSFCQDGSDGGILFSVMERNTHLKNKPCVSIMITDECPPNL